MMECLCWFLRLWSSSSGYGGFDWFKDSGLMLVLGLGFMLLQLQCGLQISRLIRSGLELIGKCRDCVCGGGICSKFDFDDFCDEKFCSCTKCLFRQLHVIQECHDSEVDLSEVFLDCRDDQPRCDAESGLFCDLESQFTDFCSCDDEVELFWDCEEDGVFDAVALREMLKSERWRADAAVVELEKERLAVASAAEEAMGMILRLQNEKSLIEIEANNYRKMAEQRMLYDHKTIQALRFLLLKHQSEQRLLEQRLSLCRQKLKLYSQETEAGQFEGLNITFSDSAMDDCNESKTALFELYS